MLSWERHIAREEEAAIKQCYTTRVSMGLHPEPRSVECTEQPCYQRCPFNDVEEYEPTIQDLEWEATTNFYKDLIEVI
jgi:hypothetical protein